MCVYIYIYIYIPPGPCCGRAGAGAPTATHRPTSTMIYNQ